MASKAVERWEKLVALATDPRTNEHEARNAAIMALRVFVKEKGKAVFPGQSGQDPFAEAFRNARPHGGTHAPRPAPPPDVGPGVEASAYGFRGPGPDPRSAEYRERARGFHRDASVVDVFEELFRSGSVRVTPRSAEDRERVQNAQQRRKVTAVPEVASHTMTARFNGRCGACGAAIRSGDMIHVVKGHAARCAKCGPFRAPLNDF